MWHHEHSAIGAAQSKHQDVAGCTMDICECAFFQSVGICFASESTWPWANRLGDSNRETARARKTSTREPSPRLLASRQSLQTAESVRSTRHRRRTARHIRTILYLAGLHASRDASRFRDFRDCLQRAGRARQSSHDCSTPEVCCSTAWLTSVADKPGAVQSSRTENRLPLRRTAVGHHPKDSGGSQALSLLKWWHTRRVA